MTLEIKLNAIVFGILFIDLFLFLIFAWTTIRKLKKNPETKDALGFEFINGLSIFSVAQALSWPRSITQKTEKKTHSYMLANANLIHQHTNTFDKILARTFYWSIIFVVISLLTLATMSYFDFFK